MGTSQTARALAASGVVALLAVGSGVASAAEEWPPRTAPRVPGASQQTPAANEPAPAPVVVPAAPEPSGRPPAFVVEMPAPRPEPASAPVTAVRTAPRQPGPPAWGRLVGMTEDRFFVRTPGNALVLFPGGLLQLDGRSFQTSNLDIPGDGADVPRARLELAGLVGGVVGFDAGVDLAHGPSLRGVDEYVSVAPWSDRLIVQAGQFDAPFTLENRISDRGLDFLERSLTARALAIPENKKQGGMVHGTNAARSYYYAAGGFFGDGQTDAMVRGWVAPFSLGRGPERLRGVTVGGSAWLGRARGGAGVGSQTTQSGFVFLDTTTRWLEGSDLTDVSLRTRDGMRAFAAELNAPFTHKLGARFEWATRHQPLDIVMVRNAGAPVASRGAVLDGWATYGEVWFWPVGDDGVLGEAGLQLPKRLGVPGLQRPVGAVQLAARLEYLTEDLAPGADPVAAAQIVSRGSTQVTAASLAANLWIARRVRATLSYSWNHPTGSSLFLTSLTDANIHELAVRLGLVL
jgi:hypothetical protein